MTQRCYLVSTVQKKREESIQNHKYKPVRRENVNNVYYSTSGVDEDELTIKRKPQWDNESASELI